MVKLFSAVTNTQEKQFGGEALFEPMVCSSDAIKRIVQNLVSKERKRRKKRRRGDA